jgi:hypothetical protein
MTTEQKYLVSYDDNWADEMDVSGSKIFDSKSELDEFFDGFKKYFEENGYYSFGIGTNEEIEYDTFSDFEEAFTIQPITDNEKEVLEKFGFGSGGQFPEIW